jgi:hypothetical protein
MRDPAARRDVGPLAVAEGQIALFCALRRSARTRVTLGRVMHEKQKRAVQVGVDDVPLRRTPCAIAAEGEQRVRRQRAWRFLAAGRAASPPLRAFT